MMITVVVNWYSARKHFLYVFVVLICETELGEAEVILLMHTSIRRDRIITHIYWTRTIHLIKTEWRGLL